MKKYRLLVALILFVIETTGFFAWGVLYQDQENQNRIDDIHEAFYRRQFFITHQMTPEQFQERNVGGPPSPDNSDRPKRWNPSGGEI